MRSQIYVDDRWGKALYVYPALQLCNRLVNSPLRLLCPHPLWFITVLLLVTFSIKVLERITIRPRCVTCQHAAPLRRCDAVGSGDHSSKQRLLCVDDGLGAASGTVHRRTSVGREGRLVGTRVVSSGAIVQTPGALAELFGFTLGSAHSLGLKRDS